MKKLLILDDDKNLANTLELEFSDHGYDVSQFNSIKDIVPAAYDFALIDMRLEGEFGLDAIGVIQNFSPRCRIVVLTGYGSIANAVEALKRGAFDYITKPAGFQQIEATLMGTKSESSAVEKMPSLSQVEHEYIDFLLTKNEGNISKTAKDLGLHRQSLQRKLKKYT